MMITYTLLIATIVLMVHLADSGALANSFDAIRGCRQFSDVPGYNDVQLYFPTSLLNNVRRTPTSRVLRIGIVGNNDGHIRYGRSTFPYDNTVVEIVIGGWANTKSAGRLQTRRRDNSYNNVLLRDASTPALLSGSRPMVFKLEIFDDGLVQLTKDGEHRPFFEFKNTQPSIPVDYIAFTKWNVNMIYFFDCPL